jgi:hypothetical protein
MSLYACRERPCSTCGNTAIRSFENGYTCGACYVKKRFLDPPYYGECEWCEDSVILVRPVEGHDLVLCTNCGLELYYRETALLVKRVSERLMK